MSRARIAIRSASTNLKLRCGAGDRKTSRRMTCARKQFLEEKRNDLDRSILDHRETRDIRRRTQQMEEAANLKGALGQKLGCGAARGRRAGASARAGSLCTAMRINEYLLDVYFHNPPGH